MRIAWIGPMPSDGGGASGVSTQLLAELSIRDVEIDCFFPGQRSALPSRLLVIHKFRYFCIGSSWQWDRWYSRNRLLAFITGQTANLMCENRLARLLVKCHRANPYDIVYQFSHIEISAIKKFRRELPPIVVHPSVHAAGELRWHKRESSWARYLEPKGQRIGARILLCIRAFVQKRHVKVPDAILSLSNNFTTELIQDYGVDARKISVVPNCIDITRFKPDAHQVSGQRRRVVILYVSRIAVRKGVEMICELSHRLEDVSGGVEIRIVGNRSLWSDYTSLLKDLNPKVAAYVGQVSGRGAEIENIYHSADILVQPSHYEPFGLTIGEALASAIPVIASDRVGSAEGVDPLCCRIFPAGDLDAMEQEVRHLINELSDSERKRHIVNKARSEAERLYQVSVVADRLLDCLTNIQLDNRYSDRWHQGVSTYRNESARYEG